MAEAAFIPGGYTYRFHRFPPDLLHALHYHLCNTVAWLDVLGLIGKINKDDLDLATIIRIYSSGSVQAGYALLNCKALRAEPVFRTLPGSQQKTVGINERSNG